MRVHKPHASSDRFSCPCLSLSPIPSYIQNYSSKFKQWLQAISKTSQEFEKNSKIFLETIFFCVKSFFLFKWVFQWTSLLGEKSFLVKLVFSEEKKFIGKTSLLVKKAFVIFLMFSVNYFKQRKLTTKISRWNLLLFLQGPKMMLILS